MPEIVKSLLLSHFYRHTPYTRTHQISEVREVREVREAASVTARLMLRLEEAKPIETPLAVSRDASVGGLQRVALSRG